MTQRGERGLLTTKWFAKTTALLTASQIKGAVKWMKFYEMKKKGQQIIHANTFSFTS